MTQHLPPSAADERTRQVLEQHDSLWKNGEPMPMYLRRLVTAKRVFGLFALLLGFWGMATAWVAVQELRVTTLESNAERNELRSESLAAELRSMQMTLTVIAAQPAVDPGILEQLRLDVIDLRERVRATPTRGDLNRLFEERVVPRLERIESQHEQFMRGRGGGS
jgi:hypothetical protein